MLDQVIVDRSPVEWEVAYKTLLEDEWTTDDSLMPDTVEFALAPEIPRAVIKRYHGDVKDLGENWETLEALDLRGKWIRIKLTHTNESDETTTEYWYGYCPAPVDNVGGSYYDEANNEIYSGSTDYYCFGIEQMLRDTMITQCKATSGRTIKRVLTFNEASRRRNSQIIGNRSSAAVDGVYLFDVHGSSQWTALDVLKHLIANWNAETGDIVTWAYDNTGDLSNIVNVWDFDGLSYYEALVRLINPSIGLTFRINGGDDIFTIEIVSTTSEDIVYNETTLVSANPNTYPIELQRSSQISRATVKHLATNLYDKVIVRGNRLRVCFTVSVDANWQTDAVMEKAWTDALATAYNGASDADRKLDKYDPVYTRFRLPSDWDGKSNGYTVMLAVDPDTGLPVDDESYQDFYLPDLVFDRSLPLADPNAELANQPRRPFVVFRSETTGEGEDQIGGEWYQGDRPGLNNTPAVGLRVLDDGAGIQLTCAYNHLVARDVFSGDAARDPVWDYREMLATVSMYTDEYARIEIDTDGQPSEITREKIIDIPNCEVWYVAPDTVTDVAGGALTRSSGEVVRDDTDLLKNAAALAAAWYGKKRSTVEIELAAPSVYPWLGYIISEASTGVTTAVNTIISNISYRFSEQGQVMTIRTSFPEINIARLLRGQRGGQSYRAGARSGLPEDLVNIPVRWGDNTAQQQSALWAKIISGSGNRYTADIYASRYTTGTLGELESLPENTPSVEGATLIIVQIATDETVPAGTWLQCTRHDDHYEGQVPIVRYAP